MVRSKTSAVRPLVMSRSWSRDSTKRGRSRKAVSNLNSAVVSDDRAPVLVASARVSVSSTHPAKVSLRPPSAPASGSGRSDSAQDRLHPRQQLARVEGLHQVVVGADLEPHDPVRILPERAEHQHRRAACRSQPARRRQPVLPRHHHVEHDEIEAARAERRVHLGHVRLRRSRAGRSFPGSASPHRGSRGGRRRQGYGCGPVGHTA